MPVGKSLKVAATAAAALGALALGAAPASAAAYGELVNDTRWPMQFASFSGSREHCDVWNNTTMARADHWSYLGCRQQPLDPGQDAGGPGDGGDVDGFTFENRTYELYMQRKASSPKMTYMGAFKKGVWTKITDIDDARCVSSGSYPTCYVTFG